jgi:hypothetical protein
MKIPSITLLLLMTVYYSFGQQNPKAWQATAGVNFSSIPTLHFAGTDTSTQRALSIAPSFSFRSPGGFGIIYTPYFVGGGSQPGIFMHMVTVGLEQYDKKDYELVADYNHFFFTGNSSIPTTPITNEVILEGAYKKLWLSPKVLAGIGFGMDNEMSPSRFAYDIELAAGICHYFDWQQDNGFSFNVTPSVLLNAGTNEYFSFLKLSKYISHSSNYKNIVKNVHASSKGQGRGNSNSNSTTTTTTTTTSASVSQPVSVNNVELNLESTVAHGSFNIRPAASLYVPVSSHSLSGYWELNLTYYF